MNDRISSEQGLKLEAKVRDICMDFPEVTEGVDKFGHTSFRIKDKPFVMLGEYAGNISMSIKTLMETQELLIQSGLFKKSPYIGRHGWSSVVNISAIDWAEMKDLLLEGFLRSAPKSIRNKLSEQNKKNV
jgi:predicted DNA-binding protein (MmcQ/YjbR family)